jgi:hypothetical protein
MWSFTVRKKKDLEVCIDLINGKLLLQKRIELFKTWVHTYNLGFFEKKQVICTPAKFSYKNAWLTGFADARGSFQISYRTRRDNGNYRVRIKFYLDQTNGFENLKTLQTFIGGVVHKRFQENQHRLVIDSYVKAPE